MKARSVILQLVGILFFPDGALVLCVSGIVRLRNRCRLNGQWPLQHHLDPGAGGQRNFIAARESHFGQAKPGANQSTLADANADMVDRSDKNSCTGCLGRGVDVGINLVHLFLARLRG